MYRHLLAFVALCFSLGHALPTNSSTSDDAPDDRTTNHKGYTFGQAGVNATFDYVVIGGGTAGLTVATRLAERAGISVAVIEAGGFYEQDNGNLSVVPGYSGAFDGTTPGVGINPLVDWNFTSTPQTGANNRVLHYTRGKTLGGCSSDNSLYYQRPTVGSLQKWADQVGDQSYTFANLLPYYKNSVQFTQPVIRYPNSTNQQDPSVFSPSGGPLQVSFGRYDDPWNSWVQKGLRDIGQALIKGFSSGVLMGTSYVAFTEDPTTETRSSSESSFLESTKAVQTKLTVYKNTFAERIIFKGRKNIADGVVVAPEGENGPDGGKYAIFAKREIILSAGAIQSPQMLMVSGIGPSATLKKHDIPILQDLPGVGQNLWDQPLFGTSFQVNLAPLPSTAEQVTEYDQSPPKGLLTVGGGAVLGWDSLPASLLRPSTLHTLSQNFPQDWPQLEWLEASVGFGPSTVPGGVYHSIITALVAPLSRGYVSINSAQMSDHPIISFNYLTNPVDQEVAVAAFKRHRQFWANISAITLGVESVPGPAVQTDTQILAYIQASLSPIWHAAATCAMGKKSDSMTVVDSKFRVIGTKRLRIVDASVFPFLPPGHPVSTVYALAEKAAVEILGG